MVILNYNDAITTIKLLNIVKKYDVIDHIIIVDNLSTDNSYELLKLCENNKIVLISSGGNFGYGYGNNYGIKYAIDNYNSDYVLICNPDVSFSEHVVKVCLLTLLANINSAVVAPRMVSINKGKCPYCAWKISDRWIDFLFSILVSLRWLVPSIHYDFDGVQKDFLQVDCVAGSMLMINIRHFLNVGMYDEKIFLYGEETVLGIKLKRAGLKTYLLLNEYFMHDHSVSINKTFKSTLKRRKMLLDSRLYILKTYYNCTKMQIILAKFLMFISLIEVNLISTIKFIRKKQLKF